MHIHKYLLYLFQPRSFHIACRILVHKKSVQLNVRNKFSQDLLWYLQDKRFIFLAQYRMDHPGIDDIELFRPEHFTAVLKSHRHTSLDHIDQLQAVVPVGRHIAPQVYGKVKSCFDVRIYRYDFVTHMISS